MSFFSDVWFLEFLLHRNLGLFQEWMCCHPTACLFLLLTCLIHLGFLFYGKGIINQVILEVIWNCAILLQGKDGLKYSFCNDHGKIWNQQVFYVADYSDSNNL